MFKTGYKLKLMAPFSSIFFMDKTDDEIEVDGPLSIYLLHTKTEDEKDGLENSQPIFKEKPSDE